VEKIFGKPLITQEEIVHRIREMGLRITRDYEGKNLVLIGILKGAFAFTADLARSIGIPAQIDFLMTSSQTESSGTEKTRVLSEPSLDLSATDVLVIEDIVDSGKTAHMIMNNLSRHNPESIRFCTLLDKTAGRNVEFTPDYIGFSIPNRFVIGYGLDYKNKYRTLPFIAVLEQSS
jgi:hypoxanthine phosphoribosyltransferase